QPVPGCRAMTGLGSPAAPQSSPEVAREAATVFLVDDDIGVLRSVAQLMDDEGLRVCAFISAEQFLDEADHSSPGCLVVDHLMPGMPGLALLRHMTGRGSTRPTVFVSGSADIEISVSAMKAGAVDFLVKPVNGATLVDAVRSALKLDSQRRRYATRRDR